MDRPRYTEGVLAFIERQAQLLANLPQTRDIAARRDRYAHYARCFAIPSSPTPVRREEVEIESAGHTLAARIYQPDRIWNDLTVLYFHGGGFVVGSIDTHDSVTAFLAHHARARVVAVDYRLAPEFSFPSQIDDAMASLRWTRERFGERAGVIAAGESAGGTLAALLCMRAVAEGGPTIDGQFLICPGPLAARLDGEEFGPANTDPFLTGSDLEFYARAYLGGQDNAAEAFPLDAAVPRGLPPALLYVAGHDPLRHQAMRYVQVLAHAGTPARVIEGDGMIHSFIRVCSVDSIARADFARLCQEMATMFHAKRRN